MLHVDEGRLSEYLDRPIDGSSDRAEIEAHLTECAECRERLEELRALKERADALLRRAAPADVAMPGFDEIEARARARRGAAPRRVLTLHRLTALGWAATIVLAAGIGWIARGVVMHEAGNASVRLDGERGTAVGGIAAPAESAAERRRSAVLSEEQREAEPAGQAGGAADEGQNLAAAAPAVAEPRRQANEAALEGAPAQPTSPPVGESPKHEQPPAVDAKAVDELRARQAAGFDTAQARMRLAERDTVARDRTLPRDTQAGARAFPTVVSLEAMTIPGAVAPAAVEGARLRRDMLAEGTWRATPPEDAAHHLGGTLRTVTGLPLQSTSVGEVDGVPAVRVVQILPGGERLEIVQWRSDSAETQARDWQAAQSRAAAAGATRTEELAIVRDGVVAVLRGQVAADSLAALARKIP